MAGLMFVVLGLLILLGIVFAVKLARDSKKGKKHKTDYYAFFIMGIIWLGAGVPLGISSDSWALFIMGIIFTMVGLSHKKDWKKNHKTWKDLDDRQKKWKIWLLLILGLLLLVAVGVYLFIQ